MRLLPPTGSMALRLAAMLALLAVVVFASVGAVLHWSLAQELRFSEQLQMEAKAHAVELLLERSQAPVTDLQREIAELQAGDGDLRIWLVDRAGHIVFGRPDLPFGAGEDRQPLVTIERTVDRSGPHAGLRIVVGLHPRARLALMRRFDRTTLQVCLGGILATGLLAVLVARRGLRPLRRLSADAAGISPLSLSQRLAAPAGAQELDPLVESFNQTLDRVERAYRQLENFSADVAHELRTPLAVMMAGLEVSLSRERPVQEMRETVGTALEEVRELSSIVDDMLFLARADRGEAAADLLPVALEEQAAQVIDFLDASIEQGGHRVRVEGRATVQANAALVRRAIFNLLGNALRHGAQGSEVVLSLEPTQHAGGARLSVRNAGPGLSEADCGRMFDRFWRREGSRSRSHESEGHGLGLSIVRAVALMHGGDTFASSRGGVTTVGLSLQAKDAGAREA
ncbi:heavy metal sensor histidine kinase [Xylophilus rhododendri]|uniref:Sensor protein n=1 Tax=Xylophilus rhododendri TaxID=2697032 RepID=A0A857J8X9_9BURK|nr:heavy metal sensor histidine kinase [Xylophilus rhododendri]QHJ00501.1 heavy metal sensor histidine kinase [Xylophilus rhododendri]